MEIMSVELDLGIKKQNQIPIPSSSTISKGDFLQNQISLYELEEHGLQVAIANSGTRVS